MKMVKMFLVLAPVMAFAEVSFEQLSNAVINDERPERVFALEGVAKHANIDMPATLTTKLEQIKDSEVSANAFRLHSGRVWVNSVLAGHMPMNFVPQTADFTEKAKEYVTKAISANDIASLMAAAEVLGDNFKLECCQAGWNHLMLTALEAGVSIPQESEVSAAMQNLIALDVVTQEAAPEIVPEIVAETVKIDLPTETQPAAHESEPAVATEIPATPETVPAQAEPVNPEL